MQEFDMIEKYLAPLSSSHAGAFNLSDDAAIIEFSDSQDLVVTKDAMAQNVHFLGDSSAQNIADRLIGSNLSDIASMGAEPEFYLISAHLNNCVNEAWIAEFSATLRAYNEQYDIALIGGDTIKSAADLSFSLTMLGKVEKGKALLRSGAKSGDLVFVSGDIGDGALGLLALQGEIEGDEYLISRYNCPKPRISLGRALIDVANSATDISDGLLADLNNICKCSKLGATIYKDKIPLSSGAKKAINKNGDLFMSSITGGDDYELIFTAPREKREKIMAMSQKLGIKISEIGYINESSGVKLLDENEIDITPLKKGYVHKI